MTYYLKYRPQTIDELDLALVRERLKNIVAQKKFSHAYLFSGPRGTGKTSAARIMAKAAGISPLDILEMDAASNRGIDDVRELRERVGLSPAAGDKKAYIIDEVHMLTTEAHNALLKTLEEPPPHVIFFLCTTESAKLPATVASRCVSVQFNKASPAEIERSLARVAAGEKLKIADELIKLLAREADGSFRDIHTILEEAALAAAGGKILETHLELVKSSSLSAAASKLADLFVAGDSRGAIDLIESLAAKGENLEKLALAALDRLRAMLISSPAPRILTVAKTVEEKVRTIRYAPLPQLTLEIAALELAVFGHPERSEHSENSDSRISSENQKAGESDSPILRNSEVSGSPSIPSFPKKATSKITLDEFLAKWPDILSGVRAKNHGIVTLLSHCRPVDCADGTVNIAVKYKFHRDQLTQDRFLNIIESAVAQVVGAPLRLKFNLSPQTLEALKIFAKDDNIAAVGDEELISTVEELFS
jgi:DNA polymerase-3 subunit gamma/tau